jgi:hypothetical protein
VLACPRPHFLFPHSRHRSTADPGASVVVVATTGGGGAAAGGGGAASGPEDDEDEEEEDAAGLIPTPLVPDFAVPGSLGLEAWVAPFAVEDDAALADPEDEEGVRREVGGRGTTFGKALVRFGAAPFPFFTPLPAKTSDSPCRGRSSVRFCVMIREKSLRKEGV